MIIRKILLSLCIFFAALGIAFSQENAGLVMPEAGVSMPALLSLFNFEVGEADELAFIFAGDNDGWQGRTPLPEGFRYQFYIVNFVENNYAVFATDQTSERRTSLHFFHQGDRNIADFYSANVPPMIMFDPTDPFIFIDNEFQLVENYYTELSNQFEVLARQRDDAMNRFEQAREDRNAAMSRLQELEETDDAYNDALAELEEKNIELLHALSELDASEYEVEVLQSRIRDLQEQVSAIEGDNDELREVVAAQEATISELEELRDPYKVRLLELDRQGATPYFNLAFMLDNYDVESGTEFLVPMVHGELGTYFSNERTGITYVLFSLEADANVNGEFGVAPQILFSLPNEIFKFGKRFSFGTSGYGSHMFERTNPGYQAIFNPFISMNVLGRDSRVGLDAGAEFGLTSTSNAYYLSFNYRSNPLYFPWLTFALDRLSFANIVGDDVAGSRFRAEAGFDINWSSPIDEDPEWGGYTHTWFFRTTYQVVTDSIQNRVSDDVGFIVGLTLSFK